MAEEKKKKIFGRKNLEGIVQDARGDYVYTGKMLVFEGEAGAWKAQIMRLWILLGGSIVLTGIVGFLPYATTGAGFHVLLPYAVALVLQLVLAWKLGRITPSGGELRKYVWEQTIRQFPALALAAAVLQTVRAVAMLADKARGVYLSGTGPLIAGIGMLLGSAALLVLFRRSMQTRAFREE